MLFNSIEFLLFFPIVTAGYFALPHRARWVWLLLASCAFYMAFIPSYILILLVTIVVDYFAGLFIERAQGRRRRAILSASIITNVGFLGFFKYYNFGSHVTAELLHVVGVGWSPPLLQIILPIGLSFHTFQAMSYTIEVYRGKQRAERHFGIYALYVLFYPQLVAGPIERPQNLLHQFREPHRFEPSRVVAGVKRMAWGMLLKVVVADRLALVVNDVFNHPMSHHGLSFVVATIFFSFQIYCDFSGYSHIALGSAQVMGFKLMENFDQPYSSRSVAEFWRRWHISLSTWFRDYVYIPLGGSRVPMPRRCFNLIIVFLISGLWHGANYTFLAWGLLHGLYLVASIFTASVRARVATAFGLNLVPRVHAAVQKLATFTLVCAAWIFFRANTMRDALRAFTESSRGLAELVMSHHLAPLSLTVSRTELLTCTLLVSALILHEQVNLRRVLEVLWRAPIWVRWATYEAVLMAILFLGRFGSEQFIYFQF
jgi:alginate O-acetyltransferase complex protein AlgI